MVTHDIAATNWTMQNGKIGQLHIISSIMVIKNSSLKLLNKIISSTTRTQILQPLMLKIMIKQAPTCKFLESVRISNAAVQQGVYGRSSFCRKAAEVLVGYLQFVPLHCLTRVHSALWNNRYYHYSGASIAGVHLATRQLKYWLDTFSLLLSIASHVYMTYCQVTEKLCQNRHVMYMSSVTQKGPLA